MQVKDAPSLKDMAAILPFFIQSADMWLEMAAEPPFPTKNTLTGISLRSLALMASSTACSNPSGSTCMPLSAVAIGVHRPFSSIYVLSSKQCLHSLENFSSSYRPSVANDGALDGAGYVSDQRSGFELESNCNKGSRDSQESISGPHSINPMRGEDGNSRDFLSIKGHSGLTAMGNDRPLT